MKPCFLLFAGVFVLASVCPRKGAAKNSPISFHHRAGAGTSVPGLALAMVVSDEVYAPKGYGFRDVERLPMTAETQMPIASMTKEFTVTALGTLVRQKLGGTSRCVNICRTFGSTTNTTTAGDDARSGHASHPSCHDTMRSDASPTSRANRSSIGCSIFRLAAI
jgi:hypothetical protein